MKILSPAAGSFQTVDGVKFTFDGERWSAGPLAEPFRPADRAGAEDAMFLIGDRVMSGFVRTARWAIRTKKEAVATARKIVAEYDAAITAPESFARLIADEEQKAVDPIQTIVVHRDGDGFWRADIGRISGRVDGLLSEYPNSMTAGDVARAIARTYRGARIGVGADEFGAATLASFGGIVWLRQGFEENGQ